jgi:4-diphosphocytidyl-2-C-methyl-D-erythritol kinase
VTSDPLRRLSPVVRVAPAKLNLTLAVIGPRSDGYHDLHSVMVPLALADRLSLAPTGGVTDTLHVVGGDAGPLEDNLVLRGIGAARRIAGPPAAAATTAPALAARLEKRIPVAAGLGGGSSDGAAALRGALEAWGVEPVPGLVADAAIRLGSDVPFFLADGPALVEGRGERVTLLPALRGVSPGIVVVTPDLPVPTADVFRAWLTGSRAATPGVALAASRHLADEWRGGLDAKRLFERAAVLAPANDLLVATGTVAWDAVLARRALARFLGRPVGQSGSGPTCWVLYPSATEAQAAADRVTEALTNGDLRLPGGPAPVVVATTVAGGVDAAPQVPPPPLIPLDDPGTTTRGRLER